MAACEGALLVVDASQGVEAQTLANAYLAIDHNLEMIPVINKIDLPSANIEEVKHQIEDVVGLDSSGAIPASAKAGIGTKEILESIVKNIPAPAGNPDAPLKALLFDSWYDTYQGVVILVRVVDGVVRPKQKIKLLLELRRLRSAVRRGLYPQDAADLGVVARRGGVHHRRHQAGFGCKDRRYGHGCRSSVPTRRFRDTRT